jgi:hypothetical protein
MLNLLMFLILYVMIITIAITSIYGGGAILYTLFGTHIIIGCIFTFLFFLISIIIVIYIERKIFKE